MSGLYTPCGRVRNEPTAQASSVLTAWTARRVLSNSPGLGADAVDQAAPSQCRISVSGVPCGPWCVPTAQTSSAAWTLTPYRADPAPVSTGGLAVVVGTAPSGITRPPRKSSPAYAVRRLIQSPAA